MIDNTSRPGNSYESAPERGKVLERPAEPLQQQQQMQSLGNQAEGVACPNCGAMNDPEALYCASCGIALRMVSCPNCGAAMEPDADFCEHCRHYVKSDVCSFCGARLTDDDMYCPECGSPRGGIVCPNCHTLNDFSFCKQCGVPLTDQAREMMEQLKQDPQFQELKQLAQEFQELDGELPYKDEQEKTRIAQSDDIRTRVLTLLMQDEGVKEPKVQPSQKVRKSKEQLSAEKENLVLKITEMLDQLQMPPVQVPAQARNYAMACKPAGIRTGWVCNYKHAVHSSPCACAKPQLGGKWIVLGNGSKS